MTLLSFSGTTSQGPFWQQILAGRKTQTCRLPRKIPIEAGDRLHLYWMVRIPSTKKPVHKIGEAVCTSVLRMQYEDFAWDDEFAVRDGFKDSRELRHLFGSPIVFGYEVYDVISWGRVDCDVLVQQLETPIDPYIARTTIRLHSVESKTVGKSAITDADVLEAVRHHHGSVIAVRTIVNVLCPARGQSNARERGVVADAVARVLEHEFGPPLPDIHGSSRATIHRQNGTCTSISKIFPKPATDQWVVRSKKTGVVCHVSTSHKRARHWSQKFLGEHGEVVGIPQGGSN